MTAFDQNVINIFTKVEDAIIKHFHLKGFTISQVKEGMDNTLKTLSHHIQCLNDGLVNLKSGRRALLKLFEIAESVKMSIERIGNFLYNVLQALRLLTFLQRLCRCTFMVKQECFSSNAVVFFSIFGLN